MTARYHFISGLPRSGSTLLAAILRQNPRFHAGISSSLPPLFTDAMEVMADEGYGLVSEPARECPTRAVRLLYG